MVVVKTTLRTTALRCRLTDCLKLQVWLPKTAILVGPISVFCYEVSLVTTQPLYVRAYNFFEFNLKTISHQIKINLYTEITKFA